MDRLESIPKELEGVLVSTPDTLHGAIRFAGTRVFAYQLFDYLLADLSVDEFIADFEGVERAQAQALVTYELSRIRSELQPAS